MHRLFVVFIGATLAAGSLDLSAQQPPAASIQILRSTHAGPFSIIEGGVVDRLGAAVPNSLVRVRNARSGRIPENLVTDKRGAFAFRPIDPGTYVVEVLNNAKALVAASSLISVNAGDTAKVVVRLPAEPSQLGNLFGQQRGDLESGAAAAVAGLLPQAVIHGIPAIVPAGDPVSERNECGPRNG
jgi:Carboxypeptidase regulatory-like domain